MTFRQMRRFSLVLSVFSLLGAGAVLSACELVGGAGQAVSAVGNGVSAGAYQTQRATGAP